jgi:uncharacterized repeat protein (TIGR01451 family)
MLILSPFAARAFERPGEPSLPNFDKRKAVAPQVKAPDPARSVALGQLRTRVPGLRVEFDELLDTPRWIASSEGFLSGPKGEGKGISPAKARAFPEDDPHRAIKAFVEEHRALFGHGAGALGLASIQRDYVTPHNGLRTVAWQQRVDDIPVADGLLIGHVTKKGELVSVSSRFLPNPDQAAQAGARTIPARRASPTLKAEEAVAGAASNLGETVGVESVWAAEPEPRGKDKHQRFKAGRLPGQADARLVWLPTDAATLRLCWRVEVARRTGGERYCVFIDAHTGEALARRCLTFYLSDASYRVFISDSPSPQSPAYPEPTTNQPPRVPRTLVTWPAFSTNASPTGWISDGENETRGNNVDAHLDRDADDQPDLPRPHGSPFRVFDPPLDLDQEPATYGDAAVVQLFYWCNWMHDRLYDLGFTEAAGNFQKDNFGRGGAAGDLLLADAQDGSGLNNANFTFTYDGEPPRIQMYVFDGARPNRDGDFDADVILHEYTHGLSTRLVGAGVGIWELQSWGLSEGWSDFYALSLLSEPGDDVDGTYVEGGYVSFGYRGLMENYYFGIRRYPYSTDLSKSPLTFKDIDPAQAIPHTGVPLSPNYRFDPAQASEVHRQGEAWCAMLWEVRANLLRKYGSELGNRLALQLVTDGMKLSPPNPNFTQSRDAILLADWVNNEGQNLNELWAGFAKRGLGLSAISPPSWMTDGVVEAFDVPDPVLVRPLSPLQFSGRVGGPLQPACRTYVLTNSTTNLLIWAAQPSVSWLDLESAGGTLDPGAGTPLALCLNSNAVLLEVGVHAATVTFYNFSSGTAQTRGVQLRVLETAEMPFAENFESGELAAVWTVTGNGSSQVTGQYEPHAGGYHLALGAAVNGYYARNEATLAIDLAGYTNVALRFWAKGLNEEPHGPPPVPFLDSANFDGVAISADGVNWYEVQGLRPLSDTYADFVVDLDAAVARYGLAYNSSFRVRFNQYGNSRLPNDGIVIDDVEITGFAPRRFTVSLPPAATEGDGVLIEQGRISLPVSVPTNLVVTLQSSAPGQLNVPPTVIIRAGESSAVFDLTIVDDVLLDGDRTVTVTASAPGYLSRKSSVVVRDNETALLTVTVPPVVSEGAGLLTGAGRVAASTAPSGPIVVSLSTSDPGQVWVPATVTIPAGATEASFDLQPVDNSRLDGSRTNTITAQVPNWGSASAAIVVLDNEVPLLGVQLPSLVREGVAAPAGSVQLSGSLPTNLVVSLASSDSNAVAVPGFVVIPAGQMTANFPLTVGNDGTPNSNRNVTVTAGAAGFASGNGSTRFLDDDTPNTAYAPSPPHLSAGNPISLRLTWRLGVEDSIANGGFEAGDLRGWGQEGSPGGGFVINDGSVDPPGPEGKVSPSRGSYSAVCQQSAPGSHTLYQDFILPVFVNSATLNWTHRIRNSASHFAADHGFRVEIRDSANSAIAIAFSTQDGDPLQGDWVERTYDLSTLRGQRIRIAFVETDSLGYLNVHLDDVRVMLDFGGVTAADVYFGTNPAPAAAEFQGTTTNAFWDAPPLTLDTPFYWQIVTRRGAAQVPSPVWQFRTRRVGPLDHFEWSAIPPTQYVNTPFPVSITARDELNNTASDFNGSATLTATQHRAAESVHVLSFVGYADLAHEYRRTLGAIAASFTNFAETSTVATDPATLEALLATKDVFLVVEQEMAPSGKLAELSKAWAPVLSNFVARGGIVIACSYQKDEHLILVNSGLLSLNRAREFSSLNLAPGVSHSLLEGVSFPFTGQGIATYEVFDGDIVVKSAGTGEAVVVARDLGAGHAVMIGTDYPVNRTGLDRIIANAIKWAEQKTQSPAPLWPGLAGYFANGVWTGQVVVQDLANDVTLTATDSAGRTGATAPLTLLAPNDLSVTISDSPDPVMVGNPILYTVILRNSGPAEARGVALAAASPHGLNYIAVSNSLGVCAVSREGVSCTYDVLPGGTATTLQLVAVPGAPGRVTNTVTVAGGPAEFFWANNTASAITRVTSPNLFVTDATVYEGQAGTVGATFVVSLDPPSSQWVSCDYFTSDLSAVADADYVPASGTVVFPPGTTNQTVTVLARGDTLDEAIEVFNLNLTNATNAVIVDTVGAGIIFDDDPSPILSISNASVTEGGLGQTTNLVFDLRLSAASGQSVSVDYFTADGSARAGRDYLPVSGTVAFAPGTTNQTVTVVVVGDENSESNETVLVKLTNPSGAILATDQAVGTILDDDAGRIEHFTWNLLAPTQLVDTPFLATLTAQDGFDNPVTDFQGPVALSGLVNSVDFEIGSGDDTWEYPLGAYYHDQRLQAIYLASEIGVPVRISALSLYVATPPPQKLNAWTLRLKHTPLDSFSRAEWEDSGWTTVYQRDETVLDTGWVTFGFSAPFEFNGSDNLMVDLSFNNASYTTNGLCLSTPTAHPRTLVFQTDSGFGNPLTWAGRTPPATASTRILNIRLTTETVAAMSPIVASNFVNGVWTGDVAIQEIVPELRLRAIDGQGHSGTGAVITVTALNDVGLRLAAAPSPASLGDNLTYTLTVSNTGPAAATEVSVTDHLPSTVAWVSSSASQGACTSSAGTVRCQFGTLPGNAAATATIVVTPTAEGFATNTATVTRAEPDTFAGNNSATAITPISPPRVFIEDATVAEGHSGLTNMTFTMRLSAPPGRPVTVRYFTSDRSAFNGVDYVGASGWVTFPVGNSTQQLNIAVLGDLIDESNETFFVNLTSPTNAVLGKAQAIGTILDDDVPPSLRVEDIAVTEGDSGVTVATFRARLSLPSALTVRFTASTSNGTATAGTDYTAVSRSLFMPPGLTNLSVNVSVLGDRLVESNETFFLNLSNPTNATIARGQAVCTILNDDGVPGKLDHLEWLPVSPVQILNQPLPVTLVARDASNNPAFGFAGPVLLSGHTEGLDAVIGRGNSSSSSPYPLATGYHDARTQVIYRTNEIGGPRRFVALALDAMLPPGQVMHRFTIRMKHTPLASFTTAAWDAGNWTTVYQADQTLLATGWVTFPLSVPFDYNGRSNLMVDFSFNNALFTSDGACRTTATNATRMLTAQTDSGFGDPLNWSGTTAPPPTPNASFPNIQLIAGSDVRVVPNVSAYFVNGVWSGDVVVRDAATNVFLVADDGNSHRALSGFFSVLGPQTDADGDGLPDLWELRYFGSLSAPGGGAADDPDQDGSDNRHEYQAGTDPLDPASVLIITAVQITGADVRLRFKSAVGHSYSLESTTDPASNLWTTVVDNVPGTGGTVEVIHTHGFAQGERFYRVRLRQ